METQKEVLQLTGLQMRPEAADVPDDRTRKLVNFDPSLKSGALVVRRGKLNLYTTTLAAGTVAITDEEVRAIARINSVRYQICGRAMFRTNSRITTEDLAANKLTAIIAFRPLTDQKTWAFFADDDLMFKDNGTNTYVWGIGKPRSPDPKVANQTGKDISDTITAGTYKIAVTQLRYDLTDPKLPVVVHESNPKEASIKVTSGSVLSEAKLEIAESYYRGDKQPGIVPTP